MNANILRCLWSFTLQMNFHDFVAALVNPVHIFHDAHTVSSWLTAEQTATCLCLSTPFQASTVFGLPRTRGEWKVLYLFLSVPTSLVVERLTHGAP